VRGRGFPASQDQIVCYSESTPWPPSISRWRTHAISLCAAVFRTASPFTTPTRRCPQRAVICGAPLAGSLWRTHRLNAQQFNFSTSCEMRGHSFPTRTAPAFLHRPLGLNLGDQSTAAGTWDIERSLLALALADVEVVGTPRRHYVTRDDLPEFIRAWPFYRERNINALRDV
jgi:hypothetical protein